MSQCKFFTPFRKFHQWIKSFLSGHRQRVILRNGTSTWRKVISGVPQGSILGPVLFLLYVNDMPELVANTAKMFADDTKLYASIQKREDCVSLQKDLTALFLWSQNWLLHFNADKCVVLRIHSAIQYMYSMNGNYLKEENEQKDLGVIISNDLKPGKHVNHIVNKANQRIGMFRRCFSGFNKEKITILYTSLVRPLLEYASPAWSPWLKKDTTRLERVQHRCLKLCQEPIHMESLQARRERMDMIDTYKYLNGLYKTDQFSSVFVCSATSFCCRLVARQ